MGYYETLGVSKSATPEEIKKGCAPPRANRLAAVFSGGFLDFGAIEQPVCYFAGGGGVWRENQARCEELGRATQGPR